MSTRRDFLSLSARAGAAILVSPAGFLFVQQGLDRWVHPLSHPDDGFEDLEFLAPLLTDVRIVQLGENGHGESEAMQTRARIARFLCERLGFGVLAFESSIFLCHLANVETPVNARRMLTSSLFGVWHTAEILPLFEQIVASRQSSRPLQLAGFDIQPIGSRRRRRIAFFGDLAAAVDPEYGRAVRALDTEFFDAYDKGSSARRQYLRQHKERLAAGYERLAAFIDSHLDVLQRQAGRGAALVARQEALSAAAYVRFQTAPDMTAYFEGRDEGMFRNLRFLADELFPDEKIVVWGHNHHVRYDNAAIPPSEAIFPGVAARSMGTWTRAHFGRGVFTIGQYEIAGTAVNNARKPYTIAQPDAGTLEHRLKSLSSSPFVLDLHGAAAHPDGAWLQAPISARYNGQHPERLVPAAQFDALLVLPSVKPPTFL